MEEGINGRHIYVIRRYYEMYANKETSILDLEEIGKVYHKYEEYRLWEVLDWIHQMQKFVK